MFYVWHFELAVGLAKKHLLLHVADLKLNA